MAGEGGDLEQGGAASDGEQLGVEQAGDDAADRVGGRRLGEQFGQWCTEVERAFGELVGTGRWLAARLGSLAVYWSAGASLARSLSTSSRARRSSTAGSLIGFSWSGSVSRSKRSVPNRCGPRSGEGWAGMRRVGTPLVKGNGSASVRPVSSSGVKRPRMRVGISVCSYSGWLVSSWQARM
ncbi:hypothetical protein [Streptomyces sp. CA-146814]|uniref:hypothetical protein n=1 Tax=Streptomyces sp. CA-146814 TaxID=3240053 RepID=UPI003D8AEE3C